jgi:hypothetical protein
MTNENFVPLCGFATSRISTPRTLFLETSCVLKRLRNTIRSSFRQATTEDSAEEVRGGTDGVPFTEGDEAVPALIHGFFEGLKSFRSVLGLVALKRVFEVLKILRRVGNGNVQIGGIGGVKTEGMQAKSR